jgi:anti-sigma B factor antagonist
MTTDATRPRQRVSGEGWSSDEHEAGNATVFVLRGEFDLAVSAKLANLLPGGRFAVASAVHAVVRPIELLGLGEVMPLHPTVAAARASWGDEA